MRSIWIAAAGLVAALTALPFLLSVATLASSALYASGNGMPVAPVSWGNEGRYTNFMICNVGSDPNSVDLTYRNSSGTLQGSQTEPVPGGQCRFFPPSLPSGFDGFAQIDGLDTGLDLVVTTTSNSDGTGPGTSFRVARVPSSQPVYPGGSVVTATLAVCNPGTSSTRYDVFGIDPNGTVTDGFQQLSNVVPGTCDDSLDGGDLFPNSSTLDPNEPVGAQGWTTGSFPEQVYWGVPTGNGTMDAREYYGPTSQTGSGEFCSPGMPVTATMTAFNAGSSNAEMLWVQYNPKGKPRDSGFETLPPLGSMNFTQPPGRSWCLDNDPDVIVSGGWGGSSSEPRSGAAAAAGTADYFSVPSRPAKKKAIAFGAVSSATSKVKVLVMNVGAKKVKVKVLIHRGDGSKIFGRSLKLKRHATGTVAYNKKAYGNDTWAEIKVRRKGSVYAWLLREDISGDKTLIPARTVQ